MLRTTVFLDQAPASSASPSTHATEGKLFSLKKWNAVAMWSWDVECDTCAICRVQVKKKEKYQGRRQILIYQNW